MLNKPGGPVTTNPPDPNPGGAGPLSPGSTPATEPTPPETEDDTLYHDSDGLPEE